jgi:hypothetical protein
MTAPGRSTVAVDAARAAPTQSRARVSVPSTDARSMPPIRARQPSRAPARMSARVLPGRARTLGIVSARDDGRSLTRAVPLRWPSVCLAPALSKDVSGRFAVNARTFRDVSGHLVALERTSADICGHLRAPPGGFADGGDAFEGRFGTFWPLAHLCVQCVAVYDGGIAGAVV